MLIQLLIWCQLINLSFLHSGFLDLKFRQYTVNALKKLRNVVRALVWCTHMDVIILTPNL